MTPDEEGRSRLHVSLRREKPPRLHRGHRQILPGVERLEGRLLLASSLSAIPPEFVPSTLPSSLLAGTIQPAAGLHVSQSPILTQVRPVVAVASSLNTAGRSRAIEPSPIPEMILHKEASGDGTYPSDDLVSTPWRPAETELGGAAEGDAIVLPPALTLDTSGLGAIPTVVNLPEIHLTGTVGPDQARATFKVALNSTTERLKIRMSRDPSSTEAGIPMIEDILMMGPRGDILTVITATYESWPDLPMEMTLTLNHVPRGATLVFHVGEAPRNVDPAAGSESSVAGSLNFTLDLSRYDPAMSLPTAPRVVLESALVAASPVIAGLYPPAVAGVSLPRAVGPASTSLGEESSTSAVETTSGGFAADLSPAADGLPGVSVGPLISRGSTAIGPTLATAPGDLTAPLDRNERAFDLASGSAGAELVPVLTSAAEQVAAAGASGTLSPPSKGIGEYSEELLLVRGPGGLPILATSALRTHHRGESAELIATLPDSRRTVAAEEQPIEGAASRPGKDAGSHSHHRKLGLFALIFGIVIGITLTSRPFYPDLLALVRIRLFGRPRPGARGGRKSGGSRWSFRAR